MADQGGGGIAWTDATWNPIRGCSRVSEGCRFCYAERMAARFTGPGAPYEGLAKQTSAGPRWTGKVRLIEEHLNDPLRWTRPRKVFVNSMSDLFHEALPDSDVLRIFDVMREAHGRGHVFQVLTKRAARMRQFCSQLNFDGGDLNGRPHRMFLEDRGLNRQHQPISFAPLMRDLWLGVSVENQEAADDRVPELLATPAAVRWLSVEPQLGPVDISKWLNHAADAFDAANRQDRPGSCDHPRGGGLCLRCGPGATKIDWVVIGGESGPGARPFELKWARDLVEQCKVAGVAVFVKQLGEVPIVPEAEWRAGPGRLLSATIRHLVPPGFVGLKFTGKAGHPEEWPPELRVREYPEARP